jgi:hypothetical protein
MVKKDIFVTTLKYRELLLETLARGWLLDDRTHMDELIGENDTRTYLTEGFNILRELIHICRRNNWLENVIPSFHLTLKNSEKFGKNPNQLFLRSPKNLIESMDNHRPPEICLEQKIWSVGIIGNRYYSNNSEYEEHAYMLSNELLYKLFGFPDKDLAKDIYIKYFYTEINNNIYLNTNRTLYERWINIEYNKNNAKTVTKIDRLTFQNEDDLEFYRKYRLEHGE